jgi:parallel beta-helix repeat protein
MVVVPACIWREQLTLNKPVTLVGRPGAEVRGSDVWTSWTLSGGKFTGMMVPTFTTSGACAPGQSRCRQPEQVFIDGRALKQVANGSAPAAGEFAIAADRSVVLGDDPTGHMVEVTTRHRWIVTHADAVTVRGLTFKHAASGPDGAISNDGYAQWTLEQSHLSDSHGPIVTVDHGSGTVVQDNLLERAGQVGVKVSASNGATVARNQVSDSNTEAFDPEDTAGGICVVAASTQVDVRGNVVTKSAGRGIVVTGGNNVTIEGNRVDHTGFTGLRSNNSDHCTFRGNVVWETTWSSDTVWGWGAGLLLWASSNIEVSENLVAWTPDGISVISQGPMNDPRWLCTQLSIHDNLVFSTGDSKETTLWKMSLGWLQDWQGPLFAPESQNHGVNNRFFSDTPEDPQVWRFSWAANPNGFGFISDFQKTPGGVGSTYLSLDEKTAVLSDAGVPASAEPH